MKQPVKQLFLVTDTHRELRVPARMAAMMIASDKTLHEVVTSTLVVELEDGSEVSLPGHEVSAREVAQEELQTVYISSQAGFSVDKVSDTVAAVLRKQMQDLSDSTREAK